MPIAQIISKARTTGVSAAEIATDIIPKRISALDEEIAKKQKESNKASQKFAEEQTVEQPIIKEESKEEYVPLQSEKQFQDLEVAQQEKIKKQADIKRQIALRINQLESEKNISTILDNAQSQGNSVYETVYDMIGKKAGAGNPFHNLESRGTAIHTRVSANMTDVKSKLRTKWAGLAQDRELAQELVRYLKDGVTKNKKITAQVKEIAEQWSKSAEQIKALRNKAGGKIGKLEDWIIPQSHDKRAMMKAGKEAWKKQIKPLLDIKRVEEQSEGNIDDILESAFNNITARVESNKNTVGGNMAKRQEESRVLHFKDGNSIINYNQLFGNEDIFAAMENHLLGQSKDIAAMQLFGSNPDLTFQNIKNNIGNEMGSIQEAKLDALWNLNIGAADGDNIISNADKLIATIGGGHRTLQVGAKLGSAAISAIADLGNIFLGSGYRGLNSFKILGTGLETLMQEALGGTKIGRNTEWASRLGIVSEYASASLANSRFAEATQIGKLAQASEAVIRSSGLGAWTNSLRAGFGLELNGRLFQDFGIKFDDLNYKNMLEEYGITASDWDKIRSTEARTLKSDSFSSDFMDIEKVYDIDEDLGYRLSEMFNTEMDAFVIMPTSRTRVWTTWGKKKGTVSGEAARNLALFKSFPISVMQMHAARWSKMTGKGKVSYLAGATASSIAFGGMSLMAYDAVTGKTPRDPMRPEFLWESTVKGGGLGIFSDLFGLAESRYGNDWYSVFLGVPFGTGEDISDIIGAIKDDIKGDDGNTVSTAYNKAKKYIPGQNLWYTRLLFSETVGDMMNEAIDENYYKKKMRKQKYMMELGQKPIFD